MDIVTISPTYQVDIPRAAFERLGLVPGQKLQVVVYADQITLCPLQSAAALRGFLHGIDTTVERSADRE